MNQPPDAPPSPWSRRRLAPILSVLLACLPTAPATAADAYVPFEGQKTRWHDGFERYDFVMDEKTLALTPSVAAERDGFGVGDPPEGKRRCVVVVPRRPAPGNPWSWRGCYWDHEPQAEIELLRRGFHVAYVSADAALGPDKTWEAWYAFLTERHGLSMKPAFIGMSRGGRYAYTWATAHPDAVACIYGDNPVATPAIFAKLGELAERDVPLLHVCGSIDPLAVRASNPVEAIYQQLGGRISVLIKEGHGHHPHSLRDPAPIADFIEQSVRPPAAPPPPPAYVGDKATRTRFYGAANSYREFPTEGTYVTCRGPLLTECYDRYAFDLPGVEGTVTVIEPNRPADGSPWVFRADHVGRDALVDLALLGKGFRVVTGPVYHNADGPKQAYWDGVYDHLTRHGFSKKPVLEGSGGAAGEMYAWAVANPARVSCVYAENPVLRSTMSKTPLLDDLAALARADVPLLHVCGERDPAFDDNTRALETRYKALGGRITVIVKEGEGHYPAGPRDPEVVVDFITHRAK